MIGFLFVLSSTPTNPTLLHVKPVNAVANRASSLRLNLIIDEVWDRRLECRQLKSIIEY